MVEKMLATRIHFNISRVSTMPVGISENSNIDNSQVPESSPAKQFKKAPYEFFGPSHNAGSSNRSAPDLFLGNLESPANSDSNLQNHFSQPQHVLQNLQSNAALDFLPGPDMPSKSAALLKLPADSGKMNILEYPRYSGNAPNFHQDSGKEQRSNFTYSPIVASSNGSYSGNTMHSSLSIYCNTLDKKDAHHPELPPTSSMATKAFHGNGIWGHQGCQPPSQYVQGLIGVILLALNTLKVEKIMPSEANITSCIRFGDPKYRNIDVKMALECALEQQMIVMQNLGDVKLCIGRLERLWKCVNPTGGNTTRYLKSMRDMIQKFLSSSSARSAIMTSENRYEAVLILKRACLKELALGEILKVLDMIITMKKWITLPQSGWQPIAINIVETNSD